MFGGDDDDDFVPAASSKLASLFSSKPNLEGNTSLTYTAPKQPKKGSNVKNESKPSLGPQTSSGSHASSSSTQLSSKSLGIIIVKAVDTYKLENSNYNPQGKLGAALLGNSTACIFQLLLYKGKQQHVTSCKISAKFQYTVQANNYGSFYDELEQNWSIHFDQKDDAEMFAKEIGLARGCVQGSNGRIESLLKQDLRTGEGSEANIGDTMEIFYSVSLFADGKQGKLVETNFQAEKPQRVKIRESVWEEGLIGAQKGTKRIILLPPNLVGPWKQDVPLDASLVVEVLVSRLKQPKTSHEGTSSVLTAIVDSAESAVDSSTDETSIKARGASISEALTASPKTHKANIISRMAKMGQATLPLKGSFTCNPSDTDSENEASSSPKPLIPCKAAPKIRSPKTQSKSFKASSPQDNSSSGSAISQHMTMYQPHHGWQHQPQPYMVGQFPVGNLEGPLFSVVSNQAIGSHQLFPSAMSTTVNTPPGMPSVDNQLSIFLSENRSHNTEVRISMAKVADKVDQMLAKLNSAFFVQPSPSNALLDNATLVASIQKLVTENEQLKTDLVEKGKKIEVQNDKIYQLLNTNHKYLEQSNASSCNEILVVELQREKMQLLENLSASKEKLQTLQTEIDSYQKDKSSASDSVAQQLSKQQEELLESKNIIEEKNESVERLTGKLKRAMEAQDCHEKTIATLRNSLQEVKDCNDKLNMEVNELTHQYNLQKVDAEEQLKVLSAKYSSQVAAFEIQEVNYKSMLEEVRQAVPFDRKSVIDEVKKIMNMVYKTLKREFSNGKSYFGEDIKETLESTIRDITCQLIEQESGEAPLPVKNQSNKSSKQDLAHSLENNETTFLGNVSECSIESVVNTNISQPKLRNRTTDYQVSQMTNSSDEILESNTYTTSMEASIDKNTEDTLPHPPTTLPGKSDSYSKITSIANKSIQGTANQFQVTLDPSVLGEAPLHLMKADPSQGASAPAVSHDLISKSTAAPLNINPAQQVGGHQASPNTAQETAEAKTRDSSMERKPWRSEPPPAPLFDDDEDEDDWLT